MAANQKATRVVAAVDTVAPNAIVSSRGKGKKKSDSSLAVSPRSMEKYLNKCRNLLGAVHAPHILVTSNASLYQMLFKPGPSRIELLKWLFCQIDDNCRNFSNNKLEEELMQFAVELGCCRESDKRILILGTCDGKEAPVEKQTKFWNLLIESVQDVRDFQAKPCSESENQPPIKSPGVFLFEIANTGNLETLATCSKLVNISPELLTLLNMKQQEQVCDLRTFGLRIKQALQILKEEMDVKKTVVFRMSKRQEEMDSRLQNGSETDANIREDLAIQVVKLKKELPAILDKVYTFDAVVKKLAAICGVNGDLDEAKYSTSTVSQLLTGDESMETNLSFGKAHFDPVPVPGLLKYKKKAN